MLEGYIEECHQYARVKYTDTWFPEEDPAQLPGPSTRKHVTSNVPQQQQQQQQQQQTQQQQMTAPVATVTTLDQQSLTDLANMVQG